MGDYTKGPWHYQITSSNQGVIYPEYGAANTLAVVYDNQKEAVEENTRLLSAAPDLLEACKLALDVLCVKYESGKGTVDADKALHAFGNLKAAINRATGKE